MPQHVKQAELFSDQWRTSSFCAAGLSNIWAGHKRPRAFQIGKFRYLVLVCNATLRIGPIYKQLKNNQASGTVESDYMNLAKELHEDHKRVTWTKELYFNEPHRLFTFEYSSSLSILQEIKKWRDSTGVSTPAVNTTPVPSSAIDDPEVPPLIYQPAVGTIVNHVAESNELATKNFISTAADRNGTRRHKHNNMDVIEAQEKTNLIRNATIQVPPTILLSEVQEKSSQASHAKEYGEDHINPLLAQI
ncbi:uncharacterized protein VP01_1052g1 [Puccinia sorghi]|uniref:Uncharacterized protein n=1 Tax=Puccinia sorghi TaxID=27349 RepID=A0A0L6VVH5_9BASI|nr:uncharacterized protein VP01_1052g1 [Puccinia sorghi]